MPQQMFVILNTQFSAIHNWPSCPIEAVSFLRNPHRHIFHVTMKFPVTHDDRDIEFINKKNEVNHFLNTLEGRNIGSMSCEELCKTLGNRFSASYVKVMEDNENGAEVYFD